MWSILCLCCVTSAIVVLLYSVVTVAIVDEVDFVLF